MGCCSGEGQVGSLFIGDMVPNFNMETYCPVKNDFGKFSLGENRGKWVILFFYPADHTFVCPTELASIASRYEEIKKLGAELISVSTDTKYSHLAWKSQEKLLVDVTYPMGADPTGAISRLFGVYDEATGLALRGTVFINPDGKLISSEINFYNLGRTTDELVRKLTANVHLASHPDEVCPANWKVSDKTLTPNAKMVGNVFEALN